MKSPSPEVAKERDALRILLAAIDFRSACIASGNEEKRGFADEQLWKAIDAGKAVLLEKPATPAPAEWTKHRIWCDVSTGESEVCGCSASRPLVAGLNEDEWLDLAERHASKDWNSDGYLSAVKALCQDFAALASTAAKADAGELVERLKLEAQMHAQEARTANATIAEIYQIVTGKTGEPGNWHGAEPVRKCIEELRAAIAASPKTNGGMGS